MECLNCDQNFVGNYCPQCNQKSSTQRLTIVSVVRDFLSAISDSDKGFLKTVIDLSKNPGRTINDYIDGKRSRYLSAGKYTFFLTVLFTLNVTYLEHHFGMFEALVKGLETASVTVDGKDNLNVSTNKKDATRNKETVYEYDSKPDSDIKIDLSNSDPTQATFHTNDDGTIDINYTFMGKKVAKKTTKAKLIKFLQKLVPHYHRTLFDVLKFLIILWIPIFSLFSFLFFFKSPYNFAEHITFNSYTFSHILLIFMIVSPAYWLLPQLSGVTFFAGSASAFFYLTFSYMQFFEMRRYRLIKSFTALSMSFFTYSCTLIMVMVALAFYIAMDNIDML